MAVPPSTVVPPPATTITGASNLTPVPVLPNAVQQHQLENLVRAIGSGYQIAVPSPYLVAAALIESAPGETKSETARLDQTIAARCEARGFQLNELKWVIHNLAKDAATDEGHLYRRDWSFYDVPAGTELFTVASGLIRYLAAREVDNNRHFPSRLELLDEVVRLDAPRLNRVLGAFGIVSSVQTTEARGADTSLASGTPELHVPNLAGEVNGWVRAYNERQGIVSISAFSYVGALLEPAPGEPADNTLLFELTLAGCCLSRNTSAPTFRKFIANLAEDAAICGDGGQTAVTAALSRFFAERSPDAAPPSRLDLLEVIAGLDSPEFKPLLRAFGVDPINLLRYRTEADPMQQIVWQYGDAEPAIVVYNTATRTLHARLGDQKLLIPDVTALTDPVQIVCQNFDASASPDEASRIEVAREPSGKVKLSITMYGWIGGFMPAIDDFEYDLSDGGDWTLVNEGHLNAFGQV